jgi:hypothetical protein
VSGTGGGGDEDYLAIAYRDATGGMKSMPDHGTSPPRADALQAPLADHGISPAQLREKVELERKS